MKTILFGTGLYYQKYKNFFHEMDIVALIDNDEQKWNHEIDGIKVISPQEGIQKKYDRIYILGSLFSEMRQQLLDLGVQAKAIYDFHDVGRLGASLPRRIYGESFSEDGSSQKVLLVSHELSLTGAPIALFSAAKVLQRAHYEVVMVSPQDGRLRHDITTAGISVVIDENLPIANLSYLEATYSYDLLFLNTACYYYIFRYCVPTRPVIWWLHESESMYSWPMLRDFSFAPIRLVSVLACSQIAKQNFLRHCTDYRVKINVQLCGFEDAASREGKGVHFPLVFAILGSVIPCKGQGVFLAAIRDLPEALRSRCVFWVVGNTDSEYARALMEQAEGAQNIFFWGERTQSEIFKMYQSIDVLVCSSYEETMSLVSIEAMMHSIPCIVTDGTGISYFVRHRIDGFVCQTGNVSEFRDAMAVLIEEPNRITAMGARARRIYEENFSMQIFRKSFLQNIKECLQYSWITMRK